MRFGRSVLHRVVEFSFGLCRVAEYSGTCLERRFVCPGYRLDFASCLKFVVLGPKSDEHGNPITTLTVQTPIGTRHVSRFEPFDHRIHALIHRLGVLSTQQWRPSSNDQNASLVCLAERGGRGHCPTSARKSERSSRTQEQLESLSQACTKASRFEPPRERLALRRRMCLPRLRSTMTASDHSTILTICRTKLDMSHGRHQIDFAAFAFLTRGGTS
jgi:hypothetical protein